MMSLWDALRMNMMISYQELVRTFLSTALILGERQKTGTPKKWGKPKRVCLQSNLGSLSQSI